MVSLRLSKRCRLLRGCKTKKYICFRSVQEIQAEHRSINYEDLGDLFLFGRIQEGLLQADIVSGSSSYIIRPSVIDEVKRGIDAGRTLMSLYSPLGHGKTVLSKILATELGAVHDVFLAVRNQESFGAELQDIISNHESPIIIIDDYYKFSRHHRELSKLTADEARFIFTARLSVYEPRKEELAAQFLNHDVMDIRIGELSQEDAISLVPLINQAGMWGSISDRTDDEKAKMLLSKGEYGFQANFADILVGLMSSNEMIGRVTKELSVLKSISPGAYEVVLLSIYLEFTNNHIDELVIDQTLDIDLNYIYEGVDTSNLYRLFFTPEKNGNGYFSGSIFAKYAMEKICDHGDLVEVIEKSAKNLASSYPIYEEMRLVLVDLLRFNYLKVIASGNQQRLKRIRELYSNLSENPSINTDDLYWNAFGMCERALKNFDSAVKQFRTSISYAKSRGPKYIPYHAQNQLIACLLEKGASDDIGPAVAFANLKEIFDLLMVQADDERTHGRGQAFAWHEELITFLTMYYPKFEVHEKMYINSSAKKYMNFIVSSVVSWESRTQAAMTVKKLQSFIAKNPA